MLNSMNTLKRQATLSLELFTVIVSHGDIGQQNLVSVAVNLWSLALKHQMADQKQMVSCQI